MKNNTNKLARSGYKHQLQDSAQGNENQVGHLWCHQRRCNGCNCIHHFLDQHGTHIDLEESNNLDYLQDQLTIRLKGIQFSDSDRPETAKRQPRFN